MILIPDSCTGEGISAGINYANAVRRGGHIPLIIPYTEDLNEIIRAMQAADGLLLPGGEDDVEPARYGEEAIAQIGPVNRRRDEFEMALLKVAAQLGKPVLGICRGIQVINVCFGGTLWQDLPSQMAEYSIEHQRPDEKWSGVHEVCVSPASRLYQTLMRVEDNRRKCTEEGLTISVNSTHHQAVRQVAPEFVVSAQSADGVIEAIEHQSLPIMAVQFHPERLATGDDRQFTELFKFK